VLALKGNQGKLHQAVEQWFEEAERQGWSGLEHHFTETLESGHHRTEHRQLWAVPITQLPPVPRQSQWLGLTTVVMVRSTRVLWNKTTTDVRFYLSSLAPDAVRHAQCRSAEIDHQLKSCAVDRCKSTGRVCPGFG
jgi:hypothetical protein